VAKLVIFRGEEVANEIRLAGRPVRIGRDNRNEIVLDDKSVSRFHAEVRAEGDRYYIVDLKSRNGVWVNGQQAKGKTALTLGAPVTLGAYELTLEDDVPTGEFDESPLLEQRSGVNAPPVEESDRLSRSSTRGSIASVTTKRRQVLMWSGVAAAVLLFAGITFAVIGYMGRPSTLEEVVNPPPAPSSPVGVVQPAAPVAEDPIKVTIDRLLTEAQAAQSSGDNASLREYVTRILELDADNPAALELKRADAASRTKPPPVAVTPPVTPPPAVAEVETPGIPRKPGEPWAEYTSRVQAIKANLEAGKTYLARSEFALAIARFKAVAAAQKGYQGVEGLIADAEAKQRVAFEQAMKYGQENEARKNWPDALKWYQNAQSIDPNATSPQVRIGPLMDRLTKDGTDIFNRADVFRKRGENAKAIDNYKRALELLPVNSNNANTERLRSEAQKWSETLKP
jgi:pSer/pThr/pTyr-binding forkhead associated (FHA) protein/tetratricopeptide (TPR) repeat protein